MANQPLAHALVVLRELHKEGLSEADLKNLVQGGYLREIAKAARDKHLPEPKTFKSFLLA